MKSNTLPSHQHPFLTLIFHPDFSGSAIIRGILLFLFLAGCSSHNQNKFYSNNYNDCDLLLKKRYSQAKFKRQPKMNNIHSANKKTRTVVKKVDPESKYVLQDPTTPPAEILTIQLSPVIESHKSASQDNIAIAESRESLQRPSDPKILLELPKPASVFSKATEYPNSFLFYGLTLGGPIALSLLLLTAFTQRSMKISAWGAHNPITSKVIIGGVQVGTGLTGLMAGSYLGDHQLFVPDELVLSAGGAAVASSLLYPRGKKFLNHFTSTYLKQKFCDVFMFSAGAVMLVSAGNMLSPETSVKPQIDHPVSEYRASFYDGQTRVKYSDQKSEPEPDPIEKKDGKGGMIFLASLLFTAGILAVAAISCSLSCSGAGTGAVAVAVLGGGALIAGYVSWLKNINKKYKVKRKNPEATA